jgi:hypothetical protein
VNFLNFFFLHSFWIEIWERSQSRLLRDGSLHAQQKATMTRSTAIQKKLPSYSQVGSVFFSLFGFVLLSGKKFIIELNECEMNLQFSGSQ